MKEVSMRDLLVVPRLQDRINLGIGVLLFISPWLLQFTDMMDAAINAWLCGLVVVGVATAALISFRQWEQWHGIALGAWIIISPWVLGFAPLVSVTALHVVLGLLLVVSESWEIWRLRHPAAAA
jgi:hypothetical protein